MKSVENVIVDSIGNTQSNIKRNILKGFGIEESNNEEIEKARVRSHSRKTKSGKLSQVKEYEDSRTKKKEEGKEGKVTWEGKKHFEYRERFYSKIKGLNKQDVENIIQDEKYFKGVDHSRASVVLEGLVDAKGNPKKFEASNAGFLYLRMDKDERTKIHTAVSRYQNDSEKKKKTSDGKDEKKSSSGKFNAKSLVNKMIKDMSLDNDYNFKASVKQKKGMEEALVQMKKEGSLDKVELIDIVTGEQGEVENKMKGSKGYKKLNKILDDIFNQAE